MGAFKFTALLRASQNSPWLQVPSPVVASATSSEWMPRSSCTPPCSARTTASTAPTAWRNWLPVGLEVMKMFSFLWPQWLGIWRPPLAGSSTEPTEPRNISLAV